MSHITVQDLKLIEGGKLGQTAQVAETVITGVSIDSRTIKPGEMFFAIKGERFDGHTFLQDVVRKGISTVVVSREWMPPALPEWDTATILYVPDTTHALGELAAIHRKKFNITVVAITGTNGKTTTKEMLCSVLSRQKRVVKSQGNFNNRYGLPLTLFQLTEESEAAVVELGASYPDEIALLCEIAHPTHGIITNIGTGHIEFLKSLDEIVRTKTALLRALPEAGMGFINGDDARLKPFKDMFDNVLTFGFSEGVDCRASHAVIRSNGCFAFTINDQLDVALNIPGEKNIYNALAAAAVGMNLGVEDAAVVRGLESFTGYIQRMEMVEWNRVSIINDSYNANPDSMKAALELLAEFPRETGSRRFAVLGDMLELGTISRNEHESIGREVARLCIDRLITIGNEARYITECAVDSGLNYAVHVDDHREAARILSEELKPGDILLVKGSRGITMEKVLEYLLEIN